MKKIAIIPARSGSKGLKNKNILMLNGKPLMAYTIEAALQSKCFDRVLVSTDSYEYGEIAQNYGAEFILRSKEASSDTASTYDLVAELFTKINPDDYNYFVLLQPTSPLRSSKNIIEAITLFENNFDKFNSLTSVVEVDKTSHLIKEIDSDLSLKNFNTIDFKNYKRQLYKEFTPNGAICISKPNWYLKFGHFFGDKSLAYFMNKEESLDIDDIYDFEIISNILSKRNPQNIIQDIKNRIQEKQHSFNNINGKITLIGHSFFDKWNITEIANKKVNNLGINRITSKLYNELIFEKNHFVYLGDYVIVSVGTNDIIFENDISKIVNEINKTLNYIKNVEHPPQKIIFINISNVNGRIDRDNNFINICKKEFKEKINADSIIDLDCLNNKFGSLDEKYTSDGLHLNNLAYEKLLNLIEKEIK